MLLLGKATRLARWAGAHRKHYRAVIRLGVATSTDDRTGSVIAEHTPSAWPEAAAIQAALSGLAATREQRPPAFSARHVAGRRSYRLARAGAPAAIEPAPVEIHRLELESYDAPRVTVLAEVGPGTYVRALARDLGERLGLGAHVEELRRLGIGAWRVEDAHPLAGLTGREPLLPPRDLVAALPGVALSDAEAALVQHGRDVARVGAAGEAALLHEDRLVAVATASETGWHPAVVLT
jgi:tRNA pseudouridine55 synthase